MIIGRMLSAYENKGQSDRFITLIYFAAKTKAYSIFSDSE